MTNYEKAEELVEKYRSTITSFLSDEMKDRNAIQCAILAVEDIIESIPSKRFWDTYNDETPSAITYYNEVLTHLNDMVK